MISDHINIRIMYNRSNRDMRTSIWKQIQQKYKTSSFLLSINKKTLEVCKLKLRDST